MDVFFYTNQKCYCLSVLPKLILVESSQGNICLVLKSERKTNFVKMQPRNVRIKKLHGVPTLRPSLVGL